MLYEDYLWHLDYVRIAGDSGFAFEKCKSSNLDKNKLYAIDIEQITKQKDVATLERYVPTIIQYSLDNDQAEILDKNFVKMFRISQLSIEYLLFCKKYLDHTLVLMKKELAEIKEQNNELKLFIEELENHITVLTEKINTQSNMTSFKCDKCSKIFSSEDYLNAHLLRRHKISNNDDVEANKLHLEIKELKERLNNTEKLLHEQNANSVNAEMTEKEDKNKDDTRAFEEIQQQFVQFKLDVENELKSLQMQKTFYEDKYVKLFDIASQTITSNKAEVVKEITQSATQTEEKNEKKKCNLQIEIVNDKNVFDFKDISSENSTEIKEIEEVVIKELEEAKIKQVEQIETTEMKDIMPEIEEKISRFEENIETKVTMGFKNIETQMQVFWNKIIEMQANDDRRFNSMERNEPKVVSRGKIDENHDAKPVVKPRSKLTNTDRIAEDTITKKFQRKTNAKMLPEPTNVDNNTTSQIMGYTQANVMYGKSETETSTSLELSEINEVEHVETKPSSSTLGKHSITSLKQAADNKKVLDNLREEVENVVKARIQEIGISDSWKGIPYKTFERAFEIVTHQANLTKKNYHEFTSIRDNIVKILASQTRSTNASKTKRFQSKKRAQRTVSSNKQEKSFRLSKRDERPHELSTVTTINKSLYDTDTDSDEVTKPDDFPPKYDMKNVKYASVIDELKSLTNKESDVKTNLDLPQEIESKQKVETKGVLKSFPSAGSLTKKRVLFDVESDSSRMEDDKPVLQTMKDGGSTTSVGSSVLDGEESRKAQSKTKKTEDYESLSDFDFSDL